MDIKDFIIESVFISIAILLIAFAFWVGSLSSSSTELNNTPYTCYCEECPITQSHILVTNRTEYVPVYVEQDLLYRENKENEGHCGWYHGETRTATLYIDRMIDFEEYLECAKHEYGHDYWNTELSSGDRHKIDNEYKNTKKFVSDYAKTNVLEYYAETYWRFRDD